MSLLSSQRGVSWDVLHSGSIPVRKRNTKVPWSILEFVYPTVDMMDPELTKISANSIFDIAPT